MNKLISLSYRLVITLVFFSTLSCSTARKIIREPLKEQGTDFLINNLKSNEFDYDYFSAKFSAEFVKDKKQNQITGQIRIHRDSLIWISVSPLMGIEMARFLVSNDSVWYINRIENTYFAGTFGYINKLINSTLDFDMLQSFLTGNDFAEYENSSFKGGIDEGEYTLKTNERRKLKKSNKDNSEVNIPIQHIWLNPETFKITRIMITEASTNGRKAEARYEHESIAGHIVPVNIKFNVEVDQDKTSAIINYSKIAIGDTLQFPFKIPTNYKRNTGF